MQSSGFDHDGERTRQRLRLEARAMLEDAEAEAERLDAATTTLRDALIDIGKQGHLVSIELDSWVDGDACSGRIVHVGTDAVAVQPDVGREVLIRTEAIGSVLVAVESVSPRTVSTGYPDTLDARLRAAAQESDEVRIGRQGLPPVRGVVVGVTSTHLYLETPRRERLLVPRARWSWMQFV